MTAFDYIVLAILGFSVLLSIWRGVVREILALAAWVLAFLAARSYGGVVAGYMPASIETPEWRLLAGLVSVFLVVLVTIALISIAVSALVKAAGLGLADRMLGAVFGLARGMLIVTVLVLLAGLTALPRLAQWRNAMFSPPLEAIALAVKPWLPEEVSRRIRYE